MTAYTLFHKASPRFRRILYFFLFFFYPPFRAASIRVRRISEDLRTFEVEMKLRCWNQNFVGTHFGGNLYAMCDPFFMLILIEAMGTKFTIWDKASLIRFKKPGKGTVSAVFHVSDETVNAVKEELSKKEKTEITLPAIITNEAGETVAEVEKVVYFRRK